MNKPTGYLMINGSAMAFWMPDGAEPLPFETLKEPPKQRDIEELVGPDEVPF